MIATQQQLIAFLQQTYQTSVFLENMAFILKHHSGTRV